MEGGQEMLPQTAHLTRFSTNTAAGGAMYHLAHFYANTMAGAKEMLPQTAHLTQFHVNTAAGRQKMDRKRKISLAISNGQADSKNYQMYSSGNKRCCLIYQDRQKPT